MRIVDLDLDETDGLYYDKTTGKLYRVKEVPTTRDSGDAIKARSIYFKGSQKQATHIMFRLITGKWPRTGMLIDHIDGNPYNNEWSNLREATPAQNMYNKQSNGRWIKDCEDLEMGVCKNGNKFSVNINRIYFGHFETKELANEVAKRERKRLQGPYARGSTETIRRRF